MKDEKIICGFCRELLTNTRGSDATYARRYRDSVRNVRRIALIVGGRLCRVGGGWMKTVSCAVVLTIAVLFGAPALAQERLGPIPPEQMTETQKQAVTEFTKVRKNGPFGFWWGYLRVPEVTIPFLEIQTYVHDVLESPKSAIGEKLTHFAILMVARQWTQQVIWSLHEANVIKSGLKPEIVSALAAGRRPTPMSDDEEILYDFCIELQQNQSVSDHTYARMLARFGEKGVAEATLLQGEYTIMSMFMNVARTPLSDPKAKPPLNAFPR